uniref:Ionotropic glutamate receptor C-terminal domain-containing protein n=1 Tax=Anopheles coluzzii TaxID=1518534 RepID=A0A6E8WBB2_ANOCL
DLHNLHRIYPNKLTNFHGYTVFMEIIRDDFPYVVSYTKGYYSGVIPLVLSSFGMQFLNLSFYYIDPNFKSNQPEVQFGLITQQDDFQQQIVFREMTGMCLLCPENTHRYFSAHLMIPFSVEFSILLGTVIICCTLLRLLFPALFRFDPLCFILFGAYRTACNHNLYTQLLLFLFAMLSFFLTKAYNSQILSLISFRNFHTRSNTIDEFMQSDYMVLAHQNQRSQFIEDILGSKLLSSEDEQRLSAKFGVDMHFFHCSLQSCCDAFELSSVYFQDESHPIYTVKEKLFSDIFRFQFAANSPFATVWKRYFGWINDAGLWNYVIQYTLNLMRVRLKAPTPPLSEVLFTFEYLMTVWQLLAVGWMISFVVFIIEYFSAWKIFTNSRFK